MTFLSKTQAHKPVSNALLEYERTTPGFKHLSAKVAKTMKFAGHGTGILEGELD